MDNQENQQPATNLGAMLEALLFAYGEPMEIKKIAALLSRGAGEPPIADGDVARAIAELEERYRGEGSGLELLISENAIQLATKPAFANLLSQLLKSEFSESLTPAALETLAIIAYGGSLPRSVIDYIRGVNSSFILRALLLRGLINRSPDPKRPNAYLYAISFEFLKHMGFARAEDLPDYSKFKDIVEKLNVSEHRVRA
jgi:segregation and condensation protein B